MTGEREIVGISIPFAFGVVIAMALGDTLFGESRYFASLLLFCLTLGFAIILWVGKVRSKEALSKSLVCVTFALVGAFCGVQAILNNGITVQNQSLVQTLAQSSGQKLKDLIDIIPFENESTNSLVKALMTGDKSGLSKELVDTFRKSGASHILALSGLHLGVIYLILVRLTLPLGNSIFAKRAKYFVVVGACLFYSLMTGANPSIVRAFLFIFLNETIRLSGRQRRPVRIFLTALTIQIVLNPMVVASLSFQLSYLAMAGIIFIFPKLDALFPDSGNLTFDKYNPMKKIWSVAAMSISCQLTTAPLVWLRFKTFPEYFLITNMIALPMTSAIILLSTVTIALSSVGTCPDFVIMINDKAVQLLVACLEIISSPDGASLS